MEYKERYEITKFLKEDIITYSIIARVVRMSTTYKAVQVEVSDGSSIWIPVSLIENDFMKHEVELFQELLVHKWFCDKYDLTEEY